MIERADAPSGTDSIWPDATTGHRGSAPMRIDPYVSSPLPRPVTGPATAGRFMDYRVAAGPAARPVALPGADVTRWPDSLLELILRRLDLADLARCSQVCRRWHQAACDPELRGRALVRAWPVWYRAMPDAGSQAAGGESSVDRALALWCQRLVPGSVRRAELEADMASGLSPQAAFYTLIKERASSSRFAAPDQAAVCCAGRPVANWCCSSDGSTLILLSRGVSDPGSRYVNFWQLGAAGPRWQVGFCYRGPVSHLCLSADGRRLRALGERAELLQWRLEVGDREREGEKEGEGGPGRLWHQQTTLSLCSGTPRQVTLSPDGDYLAVGIDGEVKVYREMAGGHWQQQCSLLCRQGPEEEVWAFRPALSPLVFSQAAGHLFFADDRGLRAFQRQGDSWQEQPLQPEPDNAGEGALDDHWGNYSFAMDVTGQWLAVAQVREDWVQGPSIRVRRLLTLWHFRQGEGWRHRGSSDCPNMDLHERRFPFPMAFSPDSQHLAFGERWDNTRQLCVLPAATPAGGWQASRLWSEQYTGDYWESRRPMFVEFSSTGRRLVTCVAQGIQIWQGQAAQAWVPLAAMINKVPAQLCCKERPGYGCSRAAFAPDGLHCALATDGGWISIWGPCGSQYQEKVAWHEEGDVDGLAFTPDGSGLMVLSSCSMTPCDDATVARLRYLPLVPV